MKTESIQEIDILIERYPALSVCRDSLIKALEILVDSFKHGGKLLVCGNGGSAADSDHIVGELMKGFEKKRPIDKKLQEKLKEIDSESAEFLTKTLQQGLPAIALTVHNGLQTAFSNDASADASFANEVLGYGVKGDVLFGISTSGNSKNVCLAAIVAKAKGVKVIGLTGEKNSKLENLCDVVIKAPSSRTYQIQEYHLPIYHCLCLALEQEFFEE